MKKPNKNLTKSSEIIKSIKFNEQGLVPAIAQDHKSKQVLMLAWMNIEAINKTIVSKEVHYWSRSRQKLWKKGESSGNLQFLKEFYVDCDHDAVLLQVEQIGPACHTGQKNCFFNKI